MALVDVIEAKDIEQLRQVLLGTLDRAKAIIEELRDGTEITVEVRFKRPPKGE